MKNFMAITFIFLLSICNNLHAQTSTNKKNKDLDSLFSTYYEARLKLKPIDATENGDNRYNDLLPVEFTDSYRAILRSFYTHYLNSLQRFNRLKLNDFDKTSYDIFKWQLETDLEGLSLNNNLMPFNQLGGVPLDIAQYGSGDVTQPFKTVKDYEKWVSRATLFSSWADSAIVYFRKGIATHIVLPKAVVLRMIPEMQSLITDTASKSVFYGPVINIPSSFTEVERKRLTNIYVKLINEQLVPSYKKLHNFLQNEYLPQARESSGLSSLPGGDSMYKYFIKSMTTTNKTPDELYNTGIAEVKRITGEIDSFKKQTGFTGDDSAYLSNIFSSEVHFKNNEEILETYRSLQKKIQPVAEKIFIHTPKTPLEIRQTEGFRAASLSAQYYEGDIDIGRPGIFFTPIQDPTQYWLAESLFLHEAIPGHHFQSMLQRENKELPKFRRFGGYNVYSEGWALYAESLGKQLGVYVKPVQYGGMLFEERFRAMRLVLDVGLHSKGWTRAQAMQYIEETEGPGGRPGEVDRYMALPGQALNYKVGALKIQELRDKCQKQLGTSFNLAYFHNEILKDGAMPLDILEQKINVWLKQQKID